MYCVVVQFELVNRFFRAISDIRSIVSFSLAMSVDCEKMTLWISAFVVMPACYKFKADVSTPRFFHHKHVKDQDL